MKVTAERPRRGMAARLVLIAGACSDRATAPEIGTLRATVQNTGGDLDLDGYALIVDSKPRPGQLFVNTSVQLAAGRHSVGLTGVAENCAVGGSPQRSVTVTADQVVDVEFDVACVATGLAVTTRTSGVAIPDAYQLVLNGRPWVSSTRTIRPSSGDWPPEKIAFVVDTTIDRIQQLWIATVNPDGSGATVLAPGYSPSWSADGTRLLFSTTDCDFYDVSCSGGLVVMDPETRVSDAVISGDAGW